MKRCFFQLIKRALPAVVSPWFWLLVHGGIAAVLLLSVLLMGVPSVNTDLFALLPPSSSLKEAARADHLLSERTGRNFMILAISDDFSLARDAAREMYEGIQGKAAFESASLYVDIDMTAAFTSFLHQYRYVFLDTETRKLLEAGETERIAADALAAAYGAFNMTSLDTLETDPFLLAGRELRHFLGVALASSGALSPKEDVLAARQADQWYVLIRGSLSPAGASVSGKSGGVEYIYALAEDITARLPGSGFVYSGVPFHSYASSSNAQRELSLISTVSLIIVFALFLWLFRSPLPVLLSVGSVGLSIGLAAASVLLLFREIHILTFVFGTTLIGISVDYSIHYFVQWKGNRDLANGAEIRTYLIRGLGLSFLSSELCFMVMLCAPFSILRQFALFSIMGLLSSFLTVLCLYPRLKVPVGRKEIVFRLPALPRYVKHFPWRRAVLLTLTAILAVTLWINREHVLIENNLGGLYTMSASLRESERIASTVLNSGAGGWYFIVKGDSPQEVLEREEALKRRLDESILNGDLSAYMAVSAYIPSVKIQNENYRLTEALLPLADTQFALFGFPAESAGLFREDHAAAGKLRFEPGDALPPLLGELWGQLWIGETGGNWYSCVLPLRLKREEALRKIAGEMDGVFWVNKVQDIGRELDSLTKTMLFLFVLSWLLVALLIRFAYSLKDSLRICAVPFLLVLTVLATLATAGISLGLFSITALVLVFGLGMDYIVYMTEGRFSQHRSLTALAVFFSFITTALSFGALSLSGFAPVHIFGLTVFAGLSAAFIFAMLLSGNGSGQNQKNSGGSSSSQPDDPALRQTDSA